MGRVLYAPTSFERGLVFMRQPLVRGVDLFFSSRRIAPTSFKVGTEPKYDALTLLGERVEAQSLLVFFFLSEREPLRQHIRNQSHDNISVGRYELTSILYDAIADENAGNEC